ncbi:MAG: flagellar hook-length control protein FliK, partial [Candidatus Sulfotelmatobacter sp.]
PLATQAVTATSAADNQSSPPDTSGDDSADSSLSSSSPHKGTAATPTVGFPAAAASSTAATPAPAVAGPATQAATLAALPGMAGPPATPGSAQPPGGSGLLNSGPANSGPASSGPPSTLPASGEFPVNPGGGPVQTAQIVNQATVNQAAQSEMRIALNTSAFGNVEVRAVVHANDVGVVIGSEKGDLRSLLSNDLPGIANTLQQQNLQLNQVSFHQPSPGFGFSSQMSSGGDGQPRSFASRPVAPLTPSAEATGAESNEPAAGLRPGGGIGLNILA